MVDDDTTFRIRSAQYGYVHHYGIYDDLDLLNFSLPLPPAHFRLTSENVLQEINTGKCVNRLTPTNRQLILTENCDPSTADRWAYDSTSHYLKDVAMGDTWCFSPWANPLPPYDISILAGVSPCSWWNHISLETGGCLSFLHKFDVVIISGQSTPKMSIFVYKWYFFILLCSL